MTRAPPWSVEDIGTIRAMADAGRSQTQIAHSLGMSATGFKMRAHRLGVPFVMDVTGKAEERGAAVLRDHYPTNPDIMEVLALFGAAVGRRVNRKIMGCVANRLGLTRGAAGRRNSATIATAARTVISTAKRHAQAVEFQALLDAGHGMMVALRMSGRGDRMVARMRAEGLIIVPPRAAVAPRAVVAKPPKPKPLPASYTRAPTPPPAPKVYQTVAEWLAAGNAVTRCPAATTEETQATTSDADRAAWRAIYESRDAERMAAGDAWRQKSHKKNRRVTA